MNRRMFTLSGIAAAASGLLGRRSVEASPPTRRRSSDGAAYLRSEQGDILSVGGPYADGETTGFFQVGIWADDYWLINQSKRNDLSDFAPKRSAENLLAIVGEEIAFADKAGFPGQLAPFGGGMGLRLTRAELIQLRDSIDAQLSVPQLSR